MSGRPWAELPLGWWSLLLGKVTTGQNDVGSCATCARSTVLARSLLDEIDVGGMALVHAYGRRWYKLVAMWLRKGLNMKPFKSWRKSICTWIGMAA